MKEKIIHLDKYEKYWIYTKEYGHDIVIFSNPDEKLTIKCVWPDRVRGNAGRLKPKEKRDAKTNNA